jgi:hypothetical protein
VEDYFEIDRLVEDLAKIYSTACATTWFKLVHPHTRPTKEEFRSKVSEFMKHLEYTLSAFPDGLEIDRFREYTREILRKEIEGVLQGANREVERRYKYYIDSL